jgi:hypothetical protein
MNPRLHLWLRPPLSTPMNASSGDLIQRKIDPIVLFFGLTSSATYGWRRAPMIVWSVLPR